MAFKLSGYSMFHLSCLPVQPQSLPVVALNHFLKASLFSAPIARATTSPMPLSSGFDIMANPLAQSGQSLRGIGSIGFDGGIFPPRGVVSGGCRVATVIRCLPLLNFVMASRCDSASTSTVRVTKIFTGRRERIDPLLPVLFHRYRKP